MLSIDAVICKKIGIYLEISPRSNLIYETPYEKSKSNNFEWILVRLTIRMAWGRCVCSLLCHCIHIDHVATIKWKKRYNISCTSTEFSALTVAHPLLRLDFNMSDISEREDFFRNFGNLTILELWSFSRKSIYLKNCESSLTQIYRLIYVTPLRSDGSELKEMHEKTRNLLCHSIRNEHGGVEQFHSA